jgi:hypothetical protein
MFTSIVSYKFLLNAPKYKLCFIVCYRTMSHVYVNVIDINNISSTIWYNLFTIAIYTTFLTNAPK